MKLLIVLCMVIVSIISVAHGTCVLDSDFGFILNCAFKKSGLFRVRNLGGLKAHFGLGFSVGDELGLAESLGNVEGNKRRALNIRGTPNNIGVLPAPKITINQPTPIVQKSRPHALTVRPPSTQQRQELPNGKQVMTNGVIMPNGIALPQGMRTNMFTGPSVQNGFVGNLPPQSMVPQSLYQKQQPLQHAHFVQQSQQIQQQQQQQQLQHQQQQQQQQHQSQQLMTEAASLPLGVPAFRPLPKKDKPTEVQQKEQNSFNRNPTQNSMFQYAIPNQMTNSTLPYPLRLDAVAQNLVYPGPVSHQDNKQAMIKNFGDQTPLAAISSPTAVIPVFQGMPQSASRVSITGTLLPPEAEIGDKITFNEIQSEPKVDLMGHTLEELASAANVSVDVIKAAIIARQQQVMAQKQVTIATTPAALPPVTKKQPSKYSLAGGSKVMNAPKEYYPVGYDKNFDDNFVSKVDLPGTTFHCGDQKHFPGLYADEDLGCMVFHVCALTDDGLIMKSFLCPESTLFDQTILKCNWWFYVDCKHSKTLYDSNIPVSKSYQLMKALTFFSKYKNQQQSSGADDGIDIEALKNSVSDNKTKNDVAN